MKTKVTEKIDELITLARQENDLPTQVVLLALRGAQCAGDDELLALHVQTFLQDILMPRAQTAKEANRIITGN